MKEQESRPHPAPPSVPWKPRFPIPRGCVQLPGHVQPFMTPRPVAHQSPLSLGFPRQEYRVGCHFLLQGIFPTNLGLEAKSPALAGGFFTTSATWEALPIFRPSSSIFKYYFCFVWDKLLGLQSFTYSILFLRSLCVPAGGSHSLRSSMCQGEGAEGRPGPVTLLAGFSGWGRLGGHTGRLQSPCSQRPARELAQRELTHCSANHPVPQTEALLFPWGLVLTLLGGCDRKKHWSRF